MKEKASARTKKLQKLDMAHLWHPFTQMKEWEAEDPLIIEKAKGCFLIDTDGKKYLDGVSSLWVNVHGHGRPEIDRAIKAQIKMLSHSTLLGLGNAPSIELAERLVKIAPKDLSRVFFSDNGSTAVEIALKMAFQYWEQKGVEGKRKFIAFTGAYHGDTFGSMSVGEIDIFVKKYRPLLFSALRAPYPYCYRCPAGKNSQNCKTECLSSFEEILKKHHGEIAACIIEPMLQGAAGMIVAPPGFLKAVRRLTRKYGVLLIADEVATGFGRTGRMFACEIENVTPDFLCLAKGITGGYLPLAATLTTSRIYRAFLGKYEEYKSFFHGHTYTGNPLGCAAALASLDIFEKAKTIEKLGPKIELFKKLLERFDGLEHVGEVRQIGLVAGVELVKDKKTKEPFPPKERVGYRACLKMREYGVILRPLGDVVVIMPPLSVRERELEEIVDAAVKGIREQTQGR